MTLFQLTSLDRAFANLRPPDAADLINQQLLAAARQGDAHRG